MFKPRVWILIIVWIGTILLLRWAVYTPARLIFTTDAREIQQKWQNVSRHRCQYTVVSKRLLFSHLPASNAASINFWTCTNQRYHWWVQNPIVLVLGLAVWWSHFASLPWWTVRGQWWHEAITLLWWLFLSFCWFWVQDSAFVGMSMMLAHFCVCEHPSALCDHHSLFFNYMFTYVARCQM
jgi:hypothetical protein